MSIIRTIEDGVEFFTIQATGASGMSESGLARLTGISQQSISELIENVGTGKVGSGCLQPLIGKDFRVQASLSGDDSCSHIMFISSTACALIIEYYGFESRYKTKAALFAFRKFAVAGIERWIQDITGWTASSLTPKTYAEELGILPRHVEVQFDRHIIYNDLLNKEITAPMYRLYIYFLDCNLVKYKPTTEEICKHARILKHNLYDLVEKMYVYGFVPEWLDIDDSTRGIEARIRDRLHAELGGEIEVQTIYGPIDLLTPTQLIEIKRIDDWKEGFGQLLVKCKKFPQHQLRLHLFGKSDRILRNIKARCKEFDIIVTYEECLVLA